MPSVLFAGGTVVASLFDLPSVALGCAVLALAASVVANIRVDRVDRKVESRIIAPIAEEVSKYRGPRDDG